MAGDIPPPRSGRGQGLVAAAAAVVVVAAAWSWYSQADLPVAPISVQKVPGIGGGYVALGDSYSSERHGERHLLPAPGSFQAPLACGAQP